MAEIKTSSLVKDFFFTGGTVLAGYYYQHRLSEDLDFFSERDLDQNSLTRQVGLMDALIAATALEHKLTLVTYNAKHFEMVEGLKMEMPGI